MRHLVYQQLMRLTVPATAAVVLFICIALYIANEGAYRWILYFFAVPKPKKYPFIDLQYIFAAVECWKEGINVYLSNPCDPLLRLYGYSPLWLRATFMPGVAWTNVFGIGLVAFFIISLIWLPAPHQSRETSITLLATISPTVVFALERGNLDVFIYIVVLVAVMMWQGSMKSRVVGYVIVLIVGALKFYPLVLLGLSVRERPRMFLFIMLIGGLIFLSFTVLFHEELVNMLPNIPKGSYFGNNFGAVDLPDGFPTIAVGSPVLVWSVLIVLSAIQIITLIYWVEFRRDFTKLPRFERELTVCGAALISGCFIVGQSIGYRGIFLLLTLPGLLALGRSSPCPRVQKLAVSASLLVLFVLWQGFVSWRGFFWEGITSGAHPHRDLFLAFWVTRELAWWWVTSILMGFLLCFVIESRSVKWMRNRCAQLLPITCHNSIYKREERT